MIALVPTKSCRHGESDRQAGQKSVEARRWKVQGQSLTHHDAEFLEAPETIL